MKAFRMSKAEWISREDREGKMGRCRCVVVSGRIFKREDRKGTNSYSDNRARECPCRADDSCGAWSVGVAHGYDGSCLRPVYVTEGRFGTEESLCDTAGGFTLPDALGST